MATEQRGRPHSDATRASDYLQVVAGAAVMALVFNGFLRPNALAPGGIAGLSIILERTLELSPHWVLWGFNFLVLGASAFALGGSVVRRSVLGAFMLPLFIWTSEQWVPTLSEDLLMAAIFGGLGTGMGIGMMFRGKGSSGGFGSLALLIHHTTGLPVGRVLLGLDIGVLLVGVWVFPLEKVLGAMIAAFIISRTSQALLSGMDSSKVVFIISKAADPIQKAVLTELDLGLTRFEGQGGYSGETRTILMVVARPGDMFRLKKLVARLDPGAFLILSNASEVLGHGFKRHVLR